ASRPLRKTVGKEGAGKGGSDPPGPQARAQEDAARRSAADEAPCGSWRRWRGRSRWSGRRPWWPWRFAAFRLNALSLQEFCVDGGAGLKQPALLFLKAFSS